VINTFVSPSSGKLKSGRALNERDREWMEATGTKLASHVETDGDYGNQIVDRTLSGRDLGRI
jgi:hypothetical protein